jgi:hypothetical protein
MLKMREEMKASVKYDSEEKIVSYSEIEKLGL